MVVLRPEVEADDGESRVGQSVEHRLDDRIEPVAAVQRVRVADDDAADRVTHGSGQVASKSVTV